ncbi:hypothetical protein ACFLTW_05600 [Chloroflexota bacterium]
MAKVKVSLRYCGSCNPHVDLGRIAHHLAGVANRRGDLLLVAGTEESVDIAVILCGCERSCGATKEAMDNAKFSIVVAGENLSATPVPEAQLPLIVEKELARIIEMFQAR